MANNSGVAFSLLFSILALSKSWRSFRLFIVCFLAHCVLVITLLELFDVNLVDFGLSTSELGFACICFIN